MYKIGEFSKLARTTIKTLRYYEQEGLLNPSFMEYLDNEYKEENIYVRYSQAVNMMGIENETIKFRRLNETKAICILYKGSYENIGDAYAFLTKYIEDNKLEVIDYFREVYINGPWNKEKPEEYLTEIEVPIK